MTTAPFQSQVLSGAVRGIFLATVRSLAAITFADFRIQLVIQTLSQEDAIMPEGMSIFDQKYRVVAIEGDRLVIRGVVSGEVLTIVNPAPDTPLTPVEYPVGKLIALTDPSDAPLN